MASCSGVLCWRRGRPVSSARRPAKYPVVRSMPLKGTNCDDQKTRRQMRNSLPNLLTPSRYTFIEDSLWTLKSDEKQSSDQCQDSAANEIEAPRFVFGRLPPVIILVNNGLDLWGPARTSPARHLVLVVGAEVRMWQLLTARKMTEQNLQRVTTHDTSLCLHICYLYFSRWSRAGFEL